MKWLRIYILPVWMFLFTNATGQTAKTNYDLFRKHVDFISNGRDTVVVLAERFLVPKTVTVSIDSVVLQENENGEQVPVLKQITLFPFIPSAGISIKF